MLYITVFLYNFFLASKILWARTCCANLFHVTSDMESLSALVQQLDKSQAANKLMMKHDFESLDNFHAITYAVTVNLISPTPLMFFVRIDLRLLPSFMSWAETCHVHMMWLYDSVVFVYEPISGSLPVLLVHSTLLFVLLTRKVV